MHFEFYKMVIHQYKLVCTLCVEQKQYKKAPVFPIQRNDFLVMVIKALEKEWI